jgi:tetratricopeptide (TPR) repeat protein
MKKNQTEALTRISQILANLIRINLCNSCRHNSRKRMAHIDICQGDGHGKPKNNEDIMLCNCLGYRQQIIGCMFNWLNRIFGNSKHKSRRRHRLERHSVEENIVRPHVPTKLPPLRPQLAPVPNWRATATFKKGDRIGASFDIYNVLGRGGFGIVYLVFDRELRKICALKTFRDELLADIEARTAFKREASRWVDLGEHPYILSAHSVMEVLGRLYVRMDYVAPDEEGRVSLAHYLRGNTRRAIELEKQMEWGIQFCLGMEHANKHGISCHRDIKPENILITSDSVLKISDFGLAVVSETKSPDDTLTDSTANSSGIEHFGLSLVKAGGRNLCGTPGYIPPEMYQGKVADVRSDIYSFGLVMWQMASQSPTPPFSPDNFHGDINAYLAAVYGAQMANKALPVDGPMQPVITKCLCHEPANRYGNFAELRMDLEILLQKLGGKIAPVTDEVQKTADSWYHHGCSMGYVGRFEDSLASFEQGLKLAPQNLKLMASKAWALGKLGRGDEGIQCCDQILLIDPKSFLALCTKGQVLQGMQQKEKALNCFEECISLYPDSFSAQHNANCCLADLGRLDKALAGCDRVIALQPRYPKSWDLKGLILAKQGKYQESIPCFDQALSHDPQFVEALRKKGFSLSKLNHFADAIACLDAALAVDPKSAKSWSEKGRILHLFKKYPNAIVCYGKALALEPNYAWGWYNKGVAEEMLKDHRAAIASFSKFLELAQPEHRHRVPAVRARIQRLRR